MPTNAASGESLAGLEIRIFQRSAEGEGYPVELTLSTPGGQQEFPRGYLPADVLPWVSSGDPERDGRRLFESLLSDPRLRAAWAQARGQCPVSRVYLRIDPAAAELHALPWELLHDESAMLSAQASTPFSRYLPVALPWGGPIEERPIRVLVAIPNPSDLGSRYNLPLVDLESEQESLRAVFSAVGAGLVQADFLPSPVTLERIEEKLRAGYHVLHYLGHGAFNVRRGQAALYLQDEQGLARVVTDDMLAGMLSRQGVRPRLVFLVACQSAMRATTDAFLGLAPRLVAVGVPAVVAMQDVVTVASGRQFSVAFYKRLLEHGQVDLAMNEARSTLLTAGRPDAGVPVLFMRLRSGRLWSAEADARGEVLGDRNPRVFWTGLVRMIQQGKCTPIIGHRIPTRCLPQHSEIAEVWAGLHAYPFADKSNLTRVAQYLASNQGADFPRYELLDFLKRAFVHRLPEELRPTRVDNTLSGLIRAAGWHNLVASDPNDPYRVLASLDLPIYLTTDFNSLMSEALRAQGKEPVREVCRWNDALSEVPSIFEKQPDYVPTPESPLVYHLFGSDEDVNSLVLTEDDCLDFLVRISAEMDRIPSCIWAALANSSLVFLGYALSDWAFRVILRGLVATREQRRKFKHVAVQLELDGSSADTAAVRDFLQHYFQDAEINVFWGSVQQFVAELREYWEELNR
ncbi:MAG: CHAT domain-containing protein [Anaerolineae bacterium]|nr:CHAT domain-containing protein [Anaerolineae bacterium]